MSVIGWQTQTFFYPDLPEYRDPAKIHNGGWVPWDRWAVVFLSFGSKNYSGVCRCALECLHGRWKASGIFWSSFGVFACVKLCAAEGMWEEDAFIGCYDRGKQRRYLSQSAEPWENISHVTTRTHATKETLHLTLYFHHQHFSHFLSQFYIIILMQLIILLIAWNVVVV